MKRKTPALTPRPVQTWTLRNDCVDAAMTEIGGMLAPVRFRMPGGGSVSPLAVAPWTGEALPDGLPPLLQNLRGDFFCAPFGGNSTPFRGEKHPPHGESANLRWTLDATTHAGDAVTLHAHMKTSIRKGRIDKRVTLRKGQTAVYCEHVLQGYSGRMAIGTHPCVQFPDREGAARISVGNWRWGQVLPVEFESPASKGYSSLRQGARFRSLAKVPLARGGFTDLSAYPARRGFEDLVMLVGDGRADFGWSAVTFPDERYVLLQLKNPRMLRHTILWLSNGGRHYAPWNGRHINVLGVEEVTSYFHLGLAESVRPNPLSKAGIPTSVTLSPKALLRVATILAVVPIPARFDSVATVCAIEGGVELLSSSGKRARAGIDLAFVTGN
ncbi:MAG: hypothetical protein KBA71_00575 [Opitutaceae bacterium]|nr:hypothetical protein [Opitutaceae bacterium]